jgi:23S rRNA (adenine2503-C2)-methyltransferase
MTDERGRLDILGVQASRFRELAAERVPSGAGLADRLYAAVFRTGAFDARGEGASEANARAWEASFSVGLLKLADRAEDFSDAGTTVKLVFATEDGHRVESVAVPMRWGKLTLCVSSQVGCARLCAFCETGRGGLVRDLRAAEIVAQVLGASLALGVRFRNIVFMGMGEPLDNLAEVAQAMAVLRERRGFSYSMERITVCTSGDAAGIRALAALGLKRLNLSVSLNAGRDELRSALMPVNRSTPLDELAAALAAYPSRRNFVLVVNYCLLPGINDGAEDARAVACFTRAVGRSLVNLIPYNPGSVPLAPSPTEEEVDRFVGLLEAEEVPVRRRERKGASVMAGCGQLGGRAGRLGDAEGGESERP